MPIPKKIRSRDLAGKTLKLAHSIRTGHAAIAVPAGTELKVTDVAGGFTLSSQDPCPACGMSIRLDYITREAVCLPDDPEAPYLESLAFWQSRSYANDRLWAECSACGFRTESCNAAVTGHSSDDYIRVAKYKFCPNCGRRMAVKDNTGRTVL